MSSLIHYLLGNARPSSQDTVLSVRRTVLAIAWLAINQSVRTLSSFLPPLPKPFFLFY